MREIPIDNLNFALARAYDKPLYGPKRSAVFKHFFESYPESSSNVYAHVA